MPKLVANFLNGTLVSDTLLSDIYSDLAYSDLLWPLRQAGNLLNVAGIHMIAPATPVIPDADRIPSIPYLRDYADMSLMLLMSFGITLGISTWKSLSALPMGLWKEAVLNNNVFSESDIRSFVDSYNEVFARLHIPLTSIVISLLLTGYVFWLPSAFGLYSGLRPPGADAAWDYLAYRGWWSNPSVGLLAFIANLVAYFTIFYYIVMNNLVGFRALDMLERADKKAKDAKLPLLVPQFGHYDGILGLSMFRLAIAKAYWGGLVLTAVLLFISYSYLPVRFLPFPLPLSVGWLPLGLWLVFISPYFFARPILFIHRQLRAAKDELLKKTFTDIRRMSSKANTAHASRRNALTLQLIQRQVTYYEIRQMPTWIFRLPRLIRYSALYLLTLIGFGANVISLMTAFK